MPWTVVIGLIVIRERKLGRESGRVTDKVKDGGKIKCIKTVCTVNPSSQVKQLMGEKSNMNRCEVCKNLTIIILLDPLFRENELLETPLTICGILLINGIII